MHPSNDPTSIVSESKPAVPVYRMRVYNPGRMTDQEIESAFVARLDVFERILKDVETEKPKSRPQHHLIIGQRGMGKTTLLLRMAVELRSSRFRERLIPLVFAEEQYSVDRLSKFWLNCLDSLADSCEREGLNDFAEKIDQVISKLEPSKGPSADKDKLAARAALDALLKLTVELKRRPVLLVDNLQLVFAQTEDQQHDLREVMTREGAPIVVAASPQLPPELNDYGHAFYDQFKTHFLKPLTCEGMQELLLSLADRSNRPDIHQHVLQRPGRLRALHQLTGGNPRTTVLLFHLYAEECAPSVSDDLERLLDDVTVLYKARFEELPEQQRVVVSEMAEHWDPIDIRKLSQSSGLSGTTLSSQLDRLRKTGFVEEVELFGTTKNGYQISERFFNVWFLMRHASRRQRRQITFLTRFLETLYEPNEREMVARRWLSASGSSTDQMLMSRAIADTLSESPLKHDLYRSTELAALEKRRSEAAREVERLIDFSQIPSKVIEFDRLRQQLLDNLGEPLGVSVLQDIDMFLSGKREKLALGVKLTSEQREALKKELKANRAIYNEDYEESAVVWLESRLTNGLLCNQRDPDEWSRTMQACQNPNEAKLVVDVLPESLSNRISSAAQKWTVDQIGHLSLVSAPAWHNQGYRYHVKLREFQKAEQAYLKAIEIDHSNAFTWNNVGSLYYHHLHRFDEAEKALRKAIEVKKNFPFAWNNLGYVLIRLGRYDEAELMFRRATEIDPNWTSPWNCLGILFCDYLGRFEDYVEAFEKALSLDPQYSSPRHNLIFLYRDFLQLIPRAHDLFQQERFNPEECPDTWHLHVALFAAYENQMDAATNSLLSALDAIPNGLPLDTTDDWIRSAAVLLKLGHSRWLCQLLENRGDDRRLRPFYEAIRAHELGDRQALLNVAVEVRSVAQWFYDEIEKRLQMLMRCNQTEKITESSKDTPTKRPKSPSKKKRRDPDCL